MTVIAERAVLTLPAKSIVPGLQVREIAQQDEPATVTAVDHDGDLLRFVLDGRPPLEFLPDAPVSLVCAPTDHPDWCEDPVKCEAQRDADGCIYHASAFTGTGATLTMTGREEMLMVSLTRLDDPDGEQCPTTVHVLPSDDTSDLAITPGQARELARLLLEAADRAEQEHDVDAEAVRVGDEILTPGGWQTVTCLLVDGPRAEIGIYTISDEDPVDRFDLDAMVRVRRTGGAA